MANPYTATDEVKAAAWDVGYQQGFADPDANQIPAPPPTVTEDYVLVFEEGFVAGQEDRAGILEPADPEGHVPKLIIRSSMKQVVKAGAGEELAWAAGWLFSIVAFVVSIPAHVTLKPLDDDWWELASDIDAKYVAVCPDTANGPMQGAQDDGTWIGTPYSDYGPAAEEAIAHIKSTGHDTAFVTMCDVGRGLCGPVSGAQQ